MQSGSCRLKATGCGDAGIAAGFAIEINVTPLITGDAIPIINVRTTIICAPEPLP